ncbi:flagellar basal body rod protein FlgB [Campylobacter mucosalis]|uniref:Flagellar basal body rod protein FlgB n=1 Tax=Campylobacter mucosalis CCUG 21559 TaxID=1032067 RepID=A0A6G5QIG8_9BACT|nr:flagellar basal body rod protein FlgB [Campylobacter mucosalis]KEA45740.1 flagellar basal body rod protein FlgB [Campylobacter mucosalis]QCD45478.1 flagellar proximal rod protein [Campylobacter mucosalis CCUG 21559]QKF63394.1 flagellar proximal rod protein FlgB [Campylobacter mucosalis]
MFVLETYKSKKLVESAMAARELRQKIIASNIANIDTPFYRARDIRFEQALSEKADEIYNRSNKKELELAKTNEAHLQKVEFPRSDMASIFFRDGHTARNDANTVDLDVETTELSKNYTMLSALDNAFSRKGSIFKSVIESSSKI